VVIDQQSPQTSWRSHRGYLDRGAAAVEMAFVMPLLILMIMGIIDFSRIFNGEIQLSQAAREGARIAALGAPGSFSLADVDTRTKAALKNPAFQGNASVVVNVNVVNVAGTTLTPNAVCAVADSTANYGQVTVSIPYTKILFGPTSLSQTAVMKCSG
jgi:Flp pilus assembly protein TadG